MPQNYDYHRIDDIRCHQELIIDHEDNLKIDLYGYSNHRLKNFFYFFLNILFLGIPFIIVESSAKLKTFKLRKCSIKDATILLVRDSFGTNTFVTVKTDKLKLPKIGQMYVQYFYFQYTKYVYDSHRELYVSLEELIPPDTVDDLLNNTSGLSEEDYDDLAQLYDLNKIQIEIKSYFKLFAEEVANPFYGFQLFSVLLWYVDDYLIYAGCVVFLSLFSIITSLVQIRKQSESLHELVESSKCHSVTVLRVFNSEPHVLNIDPVELVPGDLIVLPPNNFIMPCDAVLLNGQCIVNESVLTGESVPVTKSSLHSSDEIYSTNTHKRHTIFSGTTIIQTRYYGGENVLARVVRTGFYTTKGALVKSILFPAPVGLQFYKDSLKFVFVLFIIAASGMTYCLYLYVLRKAHIKDIIIRTLDIITIVVPPALPAAMAIGTVYSQSRLKKLGIYCISPPRINVCGKIKLACFDKTGTLTHDSLNMNSVIPCENGRFFNPQYDINSLHVKSKIVQSMATCHSLTRIDGHLTGDPLDINMFNFTHWVLEEPGEDENARFDMLAPTVVSPGPNYAQQTICPISNAPYEIGIIRQFTFSSTVQCMSVICRDLQKSHMTAFTKGAPEKLQYMCRPESLPLDFSTKLSRYTEKGYRVIAVAYKDLPIKFTWKQAQKAKREVIECDLIFLGFLIMQNPLKDETAPVIRTLHLANIRTVMITGDNILTAISVARDCGMVKAHGKVFIISAEQQDDPNITPRLNLEKVGSINVNDEIAIDFNSEHYHFAIDGKTWNILKQYYLDIVPSLLVRTTIFARFQPDQKTHLITCLQKLDYVVSMVGDGANDCGALKAAHVGVSLSQAEASVAAPFTSSIENISCLIHLMLEGRCALVTSFAIFKYMALYSLIQFISILMLYKHRSTLGDFQFLFLDLIVTTVLAITIGRQGPSRVLGAKRPVGSLISPKNVVPVILQIATCGLMQIGAIWFLFHQHWFKPIPDNVHEEVILSWENTVVFTVSCFQYIIIAIVYSKGKPFRQQLITNVWLLLSALSLIAFSVWMMIYPCKKVAELMDIIYLDDDQIEKLTFRCSLLGFPLTHTLLAVFIESCIGDTNWFKKFMQFMTCKAIPRNKYKLLKEDTSFQWWINLNEDSEIGRNENTRHSLAFIAT